ncbi:MAG: TetR/AcrR family transcriptional regulator [Acidimicrobiales bacterium]
MGIDVGQLSLRERKKARTRAALIEVSQRLFAERSYSATTLDDICSEVEVTPPTLLRYFDSKARLALAPVTDAIDELRTFLEHPGRHLPAIVVWQEFVTQEVEEVLAPSTPTTSSHVHNLRAFLRWTEKDPLLVAMVTDVERQLREMLVAAMVRDWDAAEGDLHAVVVASALVSGRWAVWNRWLADDDEPAGLLEDQLAVITYVKKRLPRSSADQLLAPTRATT